MELVDHFWAIPEYGLAFDTMGFLYKAAPDDAIRGTLEAEALRRAESLPADELRTMVERLGQTDVQLSLSWVRSFMLRAQTTMDQG